jgi:hypothetical protein
MHILASNGEREYALDNHHGNRRPTMRFSGGRNCHFRFDLRERGRRITDDSPNDDHSQRGHGHHRVKETS